ncbi:MAG: hypothetical protein JW881_14815 [Spirochaetales bacterium]|nr:hypothetical protein [Spirochaetales bacterium]
MTILATIMSLAMIIDLILLLISPKFYCSIGIPIKAVTIPNSGTRTMTGLKAGLISNFNGYKYWNDDNAIWFRTKFNLLTLYTVGFLSITKGLVVKEGENYKCLHVMNLSTSFALLSFLLLPFFYTIDFIGIIFLCILGLIMVGFTLYRNKQFNEMTELI